MRPPRSSKCRVLRQIAPQHVQHRDLARIAHHFHPGHCQGAFLHRLAHLPFQRLEPDSAGRKRRRPPRHPRETYSGPEHAYYSLLLVCHLGNAGVQASFRRKHQGQVVTRRCRPTWFAGSQRGSPGSATRPTPRELVLLAYACFVGSSMSVPCESLALIPARAKSKSF